MSLFMKLDNRRFLRKCKYFPPMDWKLSLMPLLGFNLSMNPWENCTKKKVSFTRIVSFFQQYALLREVLWEDTHLSNYIPVRGTPSNKKFLKKQETLLAINIFN